MSDDTELEFDFEPDDRDLDFDNLSMDSINPEDDRKPATVIKNASYEGFLTRITDTEDLSDKVREQLPKNIDAGIDQAEIHLAKLDKAKNAFTNPIRKELPKFKRELNKLAPTIRRYAGDTIGDKFDSLTKVKSGGAEADPDELELSQGIQSVFGEWINRQQAATENTIATRLIDNQNAEERFNLSYKLLSGISQEAKLINLYNQDVNFKWQQKSLELQYKSFHIFRNLLKVQTESNNTVITELKQITKNTGLPDLVKQQTSETFRQLFVENWQGRTIDNITDFGRGYLNKFYENVTKKAAEAGNSIRDGMSQLGDGLGMIGDMQNQQAEMDELMGELAPKRDAAVERRELLYKQIGSSIGGGIAGNLTSKVAESLGEFLTKNKTAQEANEYLGYVTANPDMVLRDTLHQLSNSTNENGERRWFSGMAEWFADALPSRSKDLEHIKSAEVTAVRDAVQMDRGMRDSQTKEVPGWLSRIHYRLSQLVYGVDAERTTYDHTSGTFTDIDTAARNILNKVQTKGDREDFNERIDETIEQIFTGFKNQEAKLGDKERSLLRELVAYESVNSQGFSPKEFMSRHNLDKFSGYDDTTRDLLNEVLTDTLISMPTISLSHKNIGNHENKRLTNVSKAFKRTSSAVDLSQEIFNGLSDTSAFDALQHTGLTRWDETTGKFVIDHDQLNKFRLGGIDKFKPTEDRGILGTAPVPPVGGAPVQPSSPLGIDPQQLADAIKGISIKMPDNGSGLLDYTAQLTSIKDKLGEIHTTINEKLGKNNTTAERKITEDSGELTRSEQFLSGILSVLGEQYIAMQKYYTADMESRGIIKTAGSFFSEALKTAGTATSWTLGKLAGFGKGTLGLLGKLNPFKGTANLLSGITGGLKEAFVIPKDIWVKGDDVPRLLGRDLYQGKYKGWDNIKADWIDKPIRTIEDIRGRVVNQNNETVISDDDIRKGLYVVEGGKMKAIGNAMVKMITTPVGAGLKFASWIAKKGTAAVSFTKEQLTNAATAMRTFKDVYVVGEDGLLSLAASAMDIKAGKIFVEIDGKKVQAKEMADLAKGAIFKMGSDGQLTMVATAESVKNGLRDFKGTVMKFSGMIGGAIGTAAKTVKSIFMAPLKLLGHGVEHIRKAFEAKAIKSLMLNLPDNVMFKANIVHIYSGEVNSVTGKGFNKARVKPKATARKTGYAEFKEDLAKAASNVSEKANSFSKDSFMEGLSTHVEKIRAKKDEGVELGKDIYAKAGLRYTEHKVDVERAKVTQAIREAYDKYLASAPVEGLLTISAFARKYKDTIIATSQLDKSAYDRVLKGGKQGKDKLVDFGNFAHGLVKPTVGEDSATIRKVVDRLYDQYLMSIKDGEPYLSKYEFAQKYIDKITEATKYNKRRVAEVLSIQNKAGAFVAGKAGNALSSFKDQVMETALKLKGSEKVKGDLDGDGTRDNSWQELYKDRMAKRAARKAARDGKPSKEKKEGGSWFGPLMGILGTGVTMLGGLVKGLLGAKAAEGILDVASTAADVGGGKGKKGLFSRILSGAGKVIKGGLKIGGSLLFGKAGLIRGGLALISGVVSSAIALPALVIGGVALATYAAYKYQKAHAKLGWLEYGRFLSYGYYTGNEESFEDKKVKLRKFEGELVNILKDKDGTLDFSMTTNEIFEEFGPIFGNINVDDGSREMFKEWFERRFKPVLFKWLKLTSDYESGVKAREKKNPTIGSHGYVKYDRQDKQVLNLLNLDEKLTKLERNFFMNSAIRFPELPWDPLMVNDAAHPDYPIEASRSHIEKFYNDFINEKAKTITGGKPPKGTGILKDLGKPAAANDASFSQNVIKGAFKPNATQTNKTNVVHYPGAPVPIKSGLAGSNAGKSDATSFTAHDYEDSFQILDKIDQRIAGYNQYLVSESLRNGIDPEMIRSVVRAESAGRSDARSHVGAMGLMQLMPDTAKWLGVKNAFDPIDNLRGGIKYVRYLLDMFKDPALAVMAYNMGQGRLKGFIKKISSDDPDDVISYLEAGNAKRGYEYESVPYVRKIAKVFEERAGKPLSNRFDGGSVGVVPKVAVKKNLPDDVVGITKVEVPVNPKQDIPKAPTPMPTATAQATKANPSAPETAKGPTEVSIVNQDTSAATAAEGVKDALLATNTTNTQLKNSTDAQTSILQTMSDTLLSIQQNGGFAAMAPQQTNKTSKPKPAANAPTMDIPLSGSPTKVAKAY